MAGIPRYEVRAGFIASDWAEIATKYTWPMIAGAFRWEELAAGPIPDTDVEEINCSRRVASIFERLQTGDLRVQVSNNRGQYTDVGSVENRLYYSESFSSLGAATGATIADAAAVQYGDGGLFGAKLFESSGGTFHFWNGNNSVAVISGQTFTAAIDVKTGERDYVQMSFSDGAGGHVIGGGIYVSSMTIGGFATGSAALISQSVQVLSNGWARFLLSGHLGPSSLAHMQMLLFNSGGGGANYSGNGSAGLYIARAQVYSGAAPFPYQKTNGSPVFASGYNPSINDVLCVKAIDASSAYSIFSGYLERWDADPSLVNLQKITLAGTDIANRLRPIISTSLAAGITHRNLLISIMSAANIPSDQYQIDAMNDVVPFAFEDQISAGEAIADVQAAGGHYCYVDARGRIQLKNRNFDVGTLTAVASYSNFFGYAIAREQDEIINRAEVQSKPREVYPSITTVAWISDAIFIPIGTTKQFLLDYVDPITQETGAPVFNLQQPVGSVDLKMNASPDGNGIDYSASVSASFVLGATAALCTISNNGTDGANAYLNICQIIGQPVTRLPDLSQTVRDQPSIAKYGERYGSVDSDLIGTANRARNLAEYIVVTSSQPSTTVQAQLKNEWPDVFQRDLLDRIAVVNSKTAVSSAFYIRELEDTITFDGGTQHVCDMRLRLAFQKWWFTLDSATLGRLDFNQLGF